MGTLDGDRFRMLRPFRASRAPRSGAVGRGVDRPDAPDLWRCHSLRSRAVRTQFSQGIYEVPSLAVRASLYMWNIFELETNHRKTSFKSLLYLVLIYPGICDKPNSQEAWLYLDVLNIPYLGPERLVVLVLPGRVGKKRSLAPCVVDKGFLESPQYSIDAREVISATAPRGRDGQVACVIANELGTDAVK